MSEHDFDELEDELFHDLNGDTDYLGQVAKAVPVVSNTRSDVEDMNALFDDLLRDDAQSLEKMSLTKQMEELDYKAIVPRQRVPTNQSSSALGPSSSLFTHSGADDPFAQWVRTGFTSTTSAHSSWAQRKEDLSHAKQIGSYYALPATYLSACHSAASANNINASLADLMRLTVAVYYAPVAEASKDALLQHLRNGISPELVSVDLKRLASLSADRPVKAPTAIPITPHQNKTLQRAQSSIVGSMPIAPTQKKTLQRAQSSAFNSTIEEAGNALKASGSTKCPELKTKLATWYPPTPTHLSIQRTQHPPTCFKPLTCPPTHPPTYPLVALKMCGFIIKREGVQSYTHKLPDSLSFISYPSRSPTIGPTLNTIGTLVIKIMLWILLPKKSF
jgi:hypothetical protein